MCLLKIVHLIDHQHTACLLLCCQIALVGKGVTFDSGGYNLKVHGGIGGWVGGDMRAGLGVLVYRGGVKC